MIAALYIDPRGPYPKLGLDCWDLERDARLYAGPHPVVAHPDCGPWSSLKHLCHGRDLAAGYVAVDQVRAYGGVLEHPARSGLFKACRLPLPGAPPDEFNGYTVEVCQCEWGHVARKRTWLYLVGVPKSALELPPFPGRAPTHWVSGGGTGKGRVPPGIHVCSPEQRRRTPQLFAEYLVRLANHARPP